MARNAFDLQLELESKGIEKGIERYRSLRKKLNEKGLESVTLPGEHLMLLLLDPLTKAIEAEQRECAAKTGRGRHKKHCVPLSFLAAEKIAFITVRQALNACTNVKTSQITRVVHSIADVVQMEIDLSQMKKRIAGEIRSTNRYAKRIGWKKAIAFAKTKYGVNSQEWLPNTREHLGARLIKLLVESTGAFECGRAYKDKKTFGILKLSDQMRRFLDEQHAICEELSLPVYAPMVCPPKPWKNPYDGGYLTIRTPMVKGLRKEHIDLLWKADMDSVYRALNLIQDTPWRINRKVYGVMSDCWKQGIYAGGLPLPDLPEPDEPSGSETDGNSKKAWRKKKREIKEINEKRRAKRRQVERILAIAKEYLQYPGKGDVHLALVRGCYFVEYIRFFVILASYQKTRKRLH